MRVKERLNLFCTRRELSAPSQIEISWVSLLSLSSKAFTYPLFGPLFRLTSSYAQLCPRRVHVEQLGFVPSHLSFLLLQITHAILFIFGAVFPSTLMAAADVCSSFSLLLARLLFALVVLLLERSWAWSSGGGFDKDDMVGFRHWFTPHKTTIPYQDLWAYSAVVAPQSAMHRANSHDSLRPCAPSKLRLSWDIESRCRSLGGRCRRE